jgi:hypothetical protein
MNKIALVGIFFITFIIFEILLYYIYKNKNIMKESFLLKNTKLPPPLSKKTSIKEPFLEAYQGSDTNYESCKKGGYPNQWCLHIPEPYGIPNPDSLTQCSSE